MDGKLIPVLETIGLMALIFIAGHLKICSDGSVGMGFLAVTGVSCLGWSIIINIIE